MKTVNQLQPTGDILINPSHHRNHFPVYLFHTTQVPTNGFVVEYPVAQCPELVQRSGHVLALPLMFRHKRERTAQVFPQQTLVLAVQQRHPEPQCQFGHDF